MPVEHAANAVLERLCGPGWDGVGLIVTDSQVVRRIPKRRVAALEKEQRRLGNAAREVAAHLQNGGTVASANEMVAHRGFRDSIRVVQGRGALLDAVRERFINGDNVWADTLATETLLVLRFWYDPSHRTVS